jgi:MFS superfamily sulfate permease-like transporter
MAKFSWAPGRAFKGYKAGSIGPDLIAGLTLAAIAAPEQMATARLAGLAPQVGLIAFVAAGVAFAVFGASRGLSSGADSTIAPIFAGELAALAASGTPHYAALAAALALLVGLAVAAAGVARMGWVGELISAPVMTGFLAGIAVHILASQAPAAMGLAAPAGETAQRLFALVLAAPRANGADVILALGVLAGVALSERLARRLPAALIAVIVATVAADALGLNVARLGNLAGGLPSLALPGVSSADWIGLVPLALLVAIVVIVQTAAVSRAFPGEGEAPQVNRDLLGVGIGSLVAGFAGAFPVDASPPRTAIVEASGGRSQLAGLTAALILGLLLVLGMGLVAQVPTAALAGILLFVATRLVRLEDMREILRRSPAEFLLVAATTLAIVILPIQWGVALGVALSILNGVWSGARVHVQPMSRLPGSTVWWPQTSGAAAHGERVESVAVLAFPAPLTFLDAGPFAREFQEFAKGKRLAVLEAAGLVMIDYTAAQALTGVIKACRAAGCDFALARLESPAAQGAFTRLGLTDLIGADHIFESVAQALAALGPRPAETEPVGL